MRTLSRKERWANRFCLLCVAIGCPNTPSPRPSPPEAGGEGDDRRLSSFLFPASGENSFQLGRVAIGCRTPPHPGPLPRSGGEGDDRRLSSSLSPASGERAGVRGCSTANLNTPQCGQVSADEHPEPPRDFFLNVAWRDSRLLIQKFGTKLRLVYHPRHQHGNRIDISRTKKREISGCSTSSACAAEPAARTGARQAMASTMGSENPSLLDGQRHAFEW